MSEATSTYSTVSFYRYVPIADPYALMEKLRIDWQLMGIKGRTYLAREGINAQVSVPADHAERFCDYVRQIFPAIAFKWALEHSDQAFAKLKIKVRKKIVADGLDDISFDPSQVGEHLDAEEFHAALDQPGTLIVDFRNQYECEVGHFQGALLPEAHTFREALPEVLEKLKGQEDKKILLYCTGGIRCEKASAYLRFKGFKDVNQLHGGIIDYAHQVERKGLQSRFLGKNFVFDQRLGERITADVIAHCHQCDTSCDDHTNCRFEGCNRLFIQCPRCAEKFTGCCSNECEQILQKTKEERVDIQHKWEESFGPHFFKSRMRAPSVQEQV